ncbi:MAG: PEP-CTERM sorting domain-containing protein [Verrucomicrobia bacterium]|nr:MAG: PEP-CTERM sorting domain-containing protein [Verrucomicrobiota bacterium]
MFLWSLMLGAWCFSLSAHAGVYSSSFSSGFVNGGVIPDGNPTGWSDTRTIGPISDHYITDVSVKLNISGGYNGDLYGYLSHAGVLIPLVNRVGVTGTGGGDAFGYANTGFDVTLSDSGTFDIHFYGQHSRTFNGSGQLLNAPYSAWQPDGRNIDPNSSPSTFDSASRASFASTYTGKDPNGSWTLFFADMSAGEQSTLVSWELDFTAAVPEPVNVALAVFGGVFVVVGLWRTPRLRGFIKEIQGNSR